MSEIISVHLRKENSRMSLETGVILEEKIVHMWENEERNEDVVDLQEYSCDNSDDDPSFIFHPDFSH